MGSQRSAEKNEYDGQERSRKGEAEEQGDNGRLCWAGSEELAGSYVDREAAKEREPEV